MEGVTMRTCKYCGTELEFYGRFEGHNQFYCDFCDLFFPEHETCFDRKRKKYKPVAVDHSITLSVKEMLQTDTITLYYSLRATRKYWYQLKQILESLTKAQKNGAFNNDPEAKEQMRNIKHEYIQVTKQKFAIENIILERTGFLPKKITDEFLANITVEGHEYDEKPMYIYIK